MKKLILLLTLSLLVISYIGCSSRDDGKGGSVIVVIPLAPSNLTAQVISTSQVNFTWSDNSTNEDGFKIERKLSNGGTYSAIGQTNKDITSFSDNSVQANTSYTYRVYAYNSAGSSISYTNEVTVFTAIVPVLTTTAISNVTSLSAVSGGNITNDSGKPVSARGVCWSTSPNPSVALITKTVDGSGTGNFTSNISSLDANTTYYVRAYATNANGTGYGNEVSFTTAQAPTAGTVFCNNVVTAVVDVTNPITGKTWMDRNLGASRVATSSTDELAYGDLYQWGRRADGHQCRNSATTTTLSTTDQPNHGNFILAPNNPNNWRNPQTVDLWQGVNGTNNPCPNGYRLPTISEWESERTSWVANNEYWAFASLKLPLAGARHVSSGVIGSNGYGNYWSSTMSGETSFATSFCQGCTGNRTYSARGFGLSIRCIKN